MVVARERPDVSFELREKLDGDGIGVLRDEIALGHFQFVALERAAPRHQLISRARGEHEKIRFVPFSLDAETRFRFVDVHAEHAGALYVAARQLRALEQQTVQNLARINHDGMRHLESRAVLLAADELDGMNEFFRIGIVEQKREALNGFVRQSAAAGFFPRQVFVEKIYFVPRARELLTAHCAGGPAANDCNFRHDCV